MLSEPELVIAESNLVGRYKVFTQRNLSFILDLEHFYLEYFHTESILKIKIYQPATHLQTSSVAWHHVHIIQADGEIEHLLETRQSETLNSEELQ